MSIATHSTVSETLRAGLLSLMETQADFDREHFTIQGTVEQKRRHICLHVMKLAGKVATAEERADHGDGDFQMVIDEVIPDLLVFAAQLSTIFDVDLPQLYEERLSTVAQRSQSIHSVAIRTRRI
jgi:hypothetical protein